jgi:phosphomannomutase
VRRCLSAGTTRLGNYSILRKQDLDGVKFFLDAPNYGGADAWILFRISGTEPLLRVYAEAASQELVEELLASGEAFVRGS